MRIAVIIPCRNAAPWIGATLRSVLEQTRPPDRILVVDNGSTDDGPARVAAIARTAPTLSLLTCPHPGAAAARAAGLAALDAQGGAEGSAGGGADAVLFLDADDLLGPTALAALADALATCPDGIAACPWNRYQQAGDGVWITAPASCAPRPREADDLTAWLSGWYHPPCAVLWSRPALRVSGGWDPSVGVNDDGDIMMRALARGVPLVRTGAGMAYYRRLPPGTPSLSGRQRERDGLLSRLGVLERLAVILAAEGKLSRYHKPLSYALARLAADAGPGEITGRAGVVLSHASGPRPRPIPPIAPVPAAVPFPADLSPDPAPTPDTPLVSVIIPTFNRAGLLQRALESVLAQDVAGMEVLVVDDASTEDIGAVVAGCGDRRVRHLRQPVNGGVAAARNRGLLEARGRFIALLDSDDEWLPGKLARQLAVFTAAEGSPCPPGMGPPGMPPSGMPPPGMPPPGMPPPGMVVTGVETVGGPRDGHDGPWIWLPEREGWLSADLLVRNILHGAPSSALIRREVVETVGLFDPALPAIEDYDYWLRLARFFPVAAVPAVLTRYHDPDPEGTATSAMAAGERRSRRFAANMAAREILFRRYAPDMERAGVDHLFLLDSAERHHKSPHGDRGAVLRLWLRAVKRRPTAAAPYGRLLPTDLRRWARAMLVPLLGRPVPGKGPGKVL
ncbi:MAG: UDP-Glc:alpha-D-GlcNAc-diphosphoundecaprenol beta,3-glucosyltransferase WfaP [Pseudomonadota bacterium]|jgi:glycosyltransferase involved in cell wall biosynthesis